METTGKKHTKYIAAWSGGKDSTYMVDELLRRGDPIDAIVFCDTGYEFDIMYEYILKVKKYWEDKYKANVILLNWGKGKEIWKSKAEGLFVKGQYEGQPRGFPHHLGMSWCTRDLKINPLRRYVSTTYPNCGIKEYVGIAVDEPNRVRTDNNEVYPMVEWGVTERDAVDSLIERGLHNPLYNTFHRTGCFTCPKQSLTSLYKIWKEYPKEWKVIEDMYRHYNDIGAGINKFKDYTIDELVAKFEGYYLKGKPTNYLEEEQEIGCMCK